MPALLNAASRRPKGGLQSARTIACYFQPRRPTLQTDANRLVPGIDEFLLLAERTAFSLASCQRQPAAPALREGFSGHQTHARARRQ